MAKVEISALKHYTLILSELLSMAFENLHWYVSPSISHGNSKVHTRRFQYLGGHLSIIKDHGNNNALL